ncbi:hypothetical protein RM53_15130 [Brevundimonas nasdae]|uniref:Major facilitator superfamily (MFS) profile domain-containing protein n=1 Tax=Brevundimonas nasdae TaxID=172043 RepID=A0A0B4CH33_9CAUL|nr:MFS transporter [Brevundimonas nasdae]KIC55742.1 hypothetical protein RM53_15130 [Brevundimonas nasdae]
MNLFLAAYLLMFLAAFIGLAPLFQIIGPLHAAGLGTGSKTQILSRAMFWGAITAAAANVVMGTISDRTTSPFGRRRPWIALGALLTILSYVGIWRSSTPAEFIWAFIGFQLAFNVLVAPLSAVFADRVPIALRSTVSAMLGLSYPLAVALGSALMALGPQYELGRLALLAGILLAAALIFLIIYDEPRSFERSERPPSSVPIGIGVFLEPFRSRNFVVVWTGRLFIATGYALVSMYLLYFLTDAVGWPGRSPERAHAFLTGISFVGVMVVAGAVALFGRRMIWRQPLALTGALLLCAATSILAIAPSWTTAVFALAVYGLGQGAYGAVEMGLMADALPTQHNRGRDMGLNNLAVALPQSIAPFFTIVLQQMGFDLRDFYVVAALCFAAAAVIMSLFQPVRR